METLAAALLRKVALGDGLTEADFVDVTAIAIPFGSPLEIAEYVIAALREARDD